MRKVLGIRQGAVLPFTTSLVEIATDNSNSPECTYEPQDVNVNNILQDLQKALQKNPKINHWSVPDPKNDWDGMYGDSFSPSEIEEVAQTITDRLLKTGIRQYCFCTWYNHINFVKYKEEIPWTENPNADPYADADDGRGFGPNGAHYYGD